MRGLLAKLSITGSRPVVSILLCTVITLWMVTGSQPYAGLNITRAQYEAALAKWNSLQLTHYEATIERTNWGKWKIVVHVDNAHGSRYAPRVRASYSHRVTRFERLDSVAASQEDAQIFEFITVGSMLDSINNTFYRHDHPCDTFHGCREASYTIVEFDETMGYPRYFRRISENDTIEYPAPEISIENVQILR